MALIIKDRIKETTTTTGLGSVVLDGTEDTFLPFSEIGVGNTTYYAIVARGNDKWEVGIGTVGSGTLSRDIVLASSHANNKVDFSAGTKDVFVTLPADKIVSKDDATGINSGISLADYVDFDTAAGSPSAVGRLTWNDQDGTLDLGLKGGNVTMQIGQEQFIRVVNKTGANLLEANYQCVKISGAQGQRPKVALARADSDLNSTDTIGLVTETIANNQEGFVTTSGIIRGINTTGSIQGETWNDGDVLYLSGSVSGKLTNVKPSAPTHTVIIGFVVHAHATQGKIFVKVDNGYELDELHNVNITSPTNGQVLAYEDGIWKNKATGAGVGTVTSVSASGGTGISVSGSPITSSGELVITNTAPDQVVSLTAGANVTVSGAYPNFTISAASGATGTITSVSVVSANGLAGTVANPTSTPAITLSTTASGLLKGNAGALESATASDVPELPQSKITNLTSDLAAKAPLASPALTGNPTAPTAAVGTNTTQIATTAFVNAEISNDAPTKTGGGASGTWGINVTGSAGSVDFNNLTNKGSGTGTYATTGDFRAPIFYDSDNTAYYLDPANTTTSGVFAGGGGFGITATINYADYGRFVVSGGQAGTSTSSIALYTQASAQGERSDIALYSTFQGTGDNGPRRTADILAGFNGGAWGNEYLSFNVGNNGSGNDSRVVTSEKMRIRSDGNVGIGTTSPDSKLMVVTDGAYNGSVASRTAIQIDNTNTTGGLTNSRIQWTWGGVGVSIKGYIEGGTYGNDYLGFGFNTTEAMRIAASGNVIAYGPMYSTIYYDTSNSAYYLDLDSTGTSLNVAGSIVAAGNVTAYSDIRVKANIEPIHGALDKLSQINGVTYTRTDLDDKERRYGGVIAQEIEAVLPEAVFDDGVKKAVDYNATIGLLIEAIKEQQAQINELKLMVHQLKGN